MIGLAIVWLLTGVSVDNWAKIWLSVNIANINPLASIMMNKINLDLDKMFFADLDELTIELSFIILLCIPL